MPNWDKHLEPPEESEIKVSNCAACGDDLLAGDEVVADRLYDLYFCNMGCAGHFIRANPDMYPAGLEGADMKVVTLEEPEPDNWDREDDEP